MTQTTTVFQGDFFRLCNQLNIYTPSRLKKEVEPDETENYSFHINLPHIIAKYNYEDTENELKQLEAFNKAMITVGDIFETLCRQEIA